jgi:hypothetical protein
MKTKLYQNNEFAFQLCKPKIFRIKVVKILFESNTQFDVCIIKIQQKSVRINEMKQYK